MRSFRFYGVRKTTQIFLSTQSPNLEVARPILFTLSFEGAVLFPADVRVLPPTLSASVPLLPTLQLLNSLTPELLNS